MINRKLKIGDLVSDAALNSEEIKKRHLENPYTRERIKHRDIFQ